MPIDMENTTYFRGTTIEKRPAVPLSIYKVFFSLPCYMKELKKLIRKIQNM